jgi:hypothetical protein
METNIITLSETSEYIYSCVLVPREAWRIERERQLDGFYMLSYSEPINPLSGWCEIKYMPIGPQFWIIGPLESITEDQAMEILGDYFITQASNGKEYYGSLWHLEYRIESKVTTDMQKVIIKTRK